ncbi:sterol O-acyltransferase 2 isoform X1 [Acipenser ruthenus]|uniref:sterol O-acyltransferase 2 isoform X1 n=1 Tax=Acipenser ruthenus TaxID=7906 RepID=UPI002741D2D2|nr:sterol O-acyltransferase 2 isoform X1 [Acipenser ruthenus]
MAAEETSSTLRQRNAKAPMSQAEEDASPASNEEHIDSAGGLIQWRRHMEDVKAELLEQIQGQLSDLLEKVISESVQSYSQHSKPPANSNETEATSRKQRLSSEQGKVFLERRSLLDELFEINHIRTIYHIFIAMLCVFIISTVAVDFIDQGRLVLEFDLLFYAFGRFSTVVFAWLCMCSYTLVVPYKALCLWGGHYHSVRFRGGFTFVVGSLVLACQACVLGVYPIYVVVHYKLPPASSFIVILEQIRFMMKSYSFIRENVPKIMKAKLNQGEAAKLPEFSSYLYFLFCPTLIYRDAYPRNPRIRWKYVALNFAQILGCLFYGYFILVRLCIPVFTNMSKEPFSTKTMVLTLFHATLPGTFVLLLCFFAFLHCWLNAFAEMLRFADRMFYKDWWNSTSFANYYRTWNVVVHDWLYSYAYKDFLWLCGGRFRGAAMLLVFIASAVVHEYVLTLCLGYFYPVMFCLFAICGGVFNFALNDKRKGAVWNVLMWTCLFIGQGIQMCLYCQEWYAQIHCPAKEKGFWEFITPRSWSCRL